MPGIGQTVSHGQIVEKLGGGVEGTHSTLDADRLDLARYPACDVRQGHEDERPQTMPRSHRCRTL